MPFSFLTAQIQVLMAAFYSTLYIIATIKVWFRDSYTDLKILPTVPGGHWLWGHEKEAWEAADGGFYSDNFEKYGRAIVMKGALFHSDILAISDPAAIAHVMQKDAFTYNKPAATRPLFGQRASDPLTWTEDQKHQHQRSILAPFFTNESVKAMSHTIHKTANKLVTTLRHHIIHDTDNDTSPYSYSFPKSTITINALDWTFAATLTVIGRVALGYDFQLGVNNPDAVAIHTAWRSIARFSTSFAAFVIPLVVRAFPFTFLVHLPASGTIQAHGEAKDVIHKRAKKIIAEKQQHPGDFEGEVGSPEKQGQDFLSTLMQQDSRHDEDSVKDILEHISTLMYVFSSFANDQDLLPCHLY
ncbi:hypothetical protein FRB94_013696 [Tulasnella sp. JGI-2019a]|nr:hypothetical protein FRB94_013696 [Tulasnella sp. JGI-2019a]